MSKRVTRPTEVRLFLINIDHILIIYTGDKGCLPLVCIDQYGRNWVENALEDLLFWEPAMNGYQ